jgi:hypothetical protein
MNDFERKLSQQPFRTPPPGLREAILGVPSNVVPVARWTWRDWFWPSPQAWAALAAVWAIFAAVSLFPGQGAPPPAAIVQQPAVPVTLLSFHQTRHFDHVLELSN